jgi:tetratricopeptide (TPR) repeat protein
MLPSLLISLALGTPLVQSAPPASPQQTSPALATDVQWQADLSHAQTLMQEGDFDEAEEHLRAMMDRATVQSLQAMAALGQLKLAVGDALGSLPFLLNAVDAFDALGETKTRRTAHIVSNLGVAFDRLERYEDAEVAARRALAIFEELHGENHREVAIALNNLAGVVHAQGRREDELALRRRESAIWRVVAPPEDPMRMQSLSAFAWNLTAAGLAEEARPLYDELIPLQTQELGEDHLVVAETRVNKGWCLQQLGEYEAARAEYEISLAAFEGQLGLEHPGLVEPLRFQAALLLGMDFPGEAAVSFARAARIVEQAEDPDLEELIWLTGGHVTALKRAGRTLEAASVEKHLDALIAESERSAAETEDGQTERP